MDEISDRLEKCFASVFPALSPEQLRAARVDTVPAWDSVSSVTLLVVVEEEFGVPLDLDYIEELSSFEGIHAFLASHTANG